MSVEETIKEHFYDVVWSLGPNQITFPATFPTFLFFDLTARALLRNQRKLESKNLRKIRSASVDHLQAEVNQSFCNIIFVTFSLVPIVGPIVGKRVSKRLVGTYTTLGSSQCPRFA